MLCIPAILPTFPGAPFHGHSSIQRTIGRAGPCHRTPWGEELQLTPLKSERLGQHGEVSVKESERLFFFLYLSKNLNVKVYSIRIIGMIMIFSNRIIILPIYNYSRTYTPIIRLYWWYDSCIVITPITIWFYRISVWYWCYNYRIGCMIIDWLNLQLWPEIPCISTNKTPW